MTSRHPAPFPKYILDEIALYLGAERRAVGRPLKILDPFAGIGRIHDLPKRIGKTVGVELEPEWAEYRAATIVGDATALPPEWTRTFDAVATSPCYGNRMSDHHEAKDSCAKCNGTGTDWSADGCGDAPMICPDCSSVACACGGWRRVVLNHNKTCEWCRVRLCSACGGSGLSRRHTYRHALGRPLTDGSAAVMQWGDGYRHLHAAAWAEAHRVLKVGGLIIVNVKNHLRDDVEQLVAEWHALTLKRQGFHVEHVVAVPAPGLRHGANAASRVDVEKLIVARSK